MKNIIKIIGTSLLAGTLLFGCSGKNNLEQRINPTQIVENVNQENEKYNTQVTDYVVPTNYMIPTSINPQSEEIVESEQTFDLYKELAKKNTSLKMDSKYLKQSDKGVEVGYDIISKNGKDYFVDYTLFDFNKDGNPEPATYMEEIESYTIDKNKTIINIIADNNISKIIITYNDKNNITFQDDRLGSEEYKMNMTSSPIKNLESTLYVKMSENNIPEIIDKNGNIYDLPYVYINSNN